MAAESAHTRGRRLVARGLFLVAVAAVVPLATGAGPPRAALHLALDHADPGGGDTLHAAPGELRLVFTEAVDPALATLGLAGPSGEVALGEPARGRSPAELVARIAAPPARDGLARGAYTVRWRVVGADGHPVSGDYTWVLVSAAEPTAPPAARADRADRADTVPGPGRAGGTLEPVRFDAESPAYVGIRWLTFVALLAVLGAVAYALLVLPLGRARAGVSESTVEPGRRAAARLGLVAAAALVILVVARLVAQYYAVHGGGAVDPDGLRALVTGSRWGRGWVAQAGGAILAVPAFLAARRGTRAGWAAAALAAVALAFAPALSGHSAAVGRLGALPVLVDGVHVLAAGGWLGTLIVLLVVAVGRATASSPSGPPDLADPPDPPAVPLAPLVSAFSAVALLLAGLVVATGVGSAWLHLATPGELWGTRYGRILLLKVAVFLPLLATGAYNWRRVRPALSDPARQEGDAMLRRSGWAEVTLAVVVLLVTAVLVATPTPDPATHLGAGVGP